MSVVKACLLLALVTVSLITEPTDAQLFGLGNRGGGATFNPWCLAGRRIARSRRCKNNDHGMGCMWINSQLSQCSNSLGGMKILGGLAKSLNLRAQVSLPGK